MTENKERNSARPEFKLEDQTCWMGFEDKTEYGTINIYAKGESWQTIIGQIYFWSNKADVEITIGSRHPPFLSTLNRQMAQALTQDQNDLTVAHRELYRELLPRRIAQIMKDKGVDGVSCELVFPTAEFNSVMSQDSDKVDLVRRLIDFSGFDLENIEVAQAPVKDYVSFDLVLKAKEKK